jgi:hypothetical protein
MMDLYEESFYWLLCGIAYFIFAVVSCANVLLLVLCWLGIGIIRLMVIPIMPFVAIGKCLELLLDKLKIHGRI